MKAKPSHYFLAGLVVIEIAAFMADIRWGEGAYIIATFIAGVLLMLAGPLFLEMDNLE